MSVFLGMSPDELLGQNLLLPRSGLDTMPPDPPWPPSPSAGWDWPVEGLPHPDSPAGRNFVWADLGLPHPDSPAGRNADWSAWGLPHPRSPAGREPTGSSGRVSTSVDRWGQRHLHLDVGLGRPIEIIGAPRQGPVSLPAWLPDSIQQKIPSLPSGVHRFKGPPPFGDIVLWTRLGTFGREIEAYQEFPEDEAFYLRFARGDAVLARRLREILAEYNAYLRYFVEERGLSPYQARDEIRRIYNDEFIATILDAFIELMGAAAGAAINSLGQQAERILDAARRTRWQPGPRIRTRPRSPSAAGEASSSPTKPPTGGATTGTKPPVQGESSSTFSEFPRQVVAKPKAPPPKINRQKQNGHVKGKPQNNNRAKVGKPTSTFDNVEDADRLTQEAWENGKPLPGKPNVREHDFGRPIGTGPKGGSQSRVRVHQNAKGEIHGHPSGPETPIP